MRIHLLAASLVAASQLTACATMQLQIPVEEAPKLESRSVRTIEGQVRGLAETYTLSPVANDGEVLLLDPADSTLLHAYSKEDAMKPPLLSLGDAPLMKGPVRAGITGTELVLIGEDARFTAPVASVKWLRILQVDENRSALRVVGIGVGVLGASLAAAWLLGAFR